MAQMKYTTVRVEIANYESVDALYRACELARDIAYEQPWNIEAKELVEALTIAASGLAAAKNTKP